MSASDTIHQRLVKREWWLVFAIILCAFAIRLYQIYNLMPFTYDQGRDMYVLQSISRGDLTLIGPTTGLPGVFLGPFMYYLLLPGFILTNGSPFGVVIWLMAWNVAMLPFFYLLLKPITGRWWAMIGLVLVALTPGSIELSRVIWNPSLVVPILLPSIYCLFASRGQPWLLIVSCFLYGLGLQTELAYTIFLAPLFGLWVLNESQLAKWWRRDSSFVPSYSLPVLAAAFLAFLSTLLPQILFELRNQFLISTSMLREMSDSTKQVPLSKVWAERPAQIMAELKRSVTGNALNDTLAQLLVWASFVSVLFANFKLKHRPEVWFWTGYLFLPLLALLVHRGNYGQFFDYYITAHFLPVVGALILGLSTFRAKYVLGVGLLMVWAVMFARYAPGMFTVSNFRYTAQLEIQALRYAREISLSEDPAIEVFVPNLIPVAYQYLSEWLSRTGKATPIDFGGAGHSEYILIYEPAISDGSKVAFKKWYEFWTKEAKCDLKQEFGITTVERCRREL